MNKDLIQLTQIVINLFGYIAAFSLLIPLSKAQLNENCTVSLLNRTANVQPDEGWTLPNVSSNLGQVRARAICVENGVTKPGQSDFLFSNTNQVKRSLKYFLRRF